MANKNYIGNSTTIGKFLLIGFAGWIISLAASKGLNLPVDAATLAQILGFLAGIVYSYLDAKYPNTFDWLGNAMNKTIDAEETVLNDEYVTGEDFEQWNLPTTWRANTGTGKKNRWIRGTRQFQRTTYYGTHWW